MGRSKNQRLLYGMVARRARRLSLRSSLLRKSFQGALDSIEPLLQLSRSQRRVRRARRQTRIAAPPVETDLLGLVDRAHQQPYLDRQQLDVREIDFDIAGDDQALIEDAVEDIYQAVRARWINELGQSGDPRVAFPRSR